jgi:hypothetical protein
MGSAVYMIWSTQCQTGKCAKLSKVDKVELKTVKIKSTKVKTTKVKKEQNKKGRIKGNARVKK